MSNGSARRALLGLTLAASATPATAPLAAQPARPPGHAAPLAARAEWAAAFDSAGQRGVFVVRRLGRPARDAAGAFDADDRDAYPALTNDTVRARRPYLPASTFKIPNTLLALELGVVRDERQRFAVTWPPQEIAAWNRPHTFATALTYSVVPVYQIVARRVGEARYRTWLRRLAYGNADPSGGVDHFWLDGALRTSAADQIDFLGRLAARRLALSERSQRATAAMLVREAGPACVLRAKTGLVGVSAQRTLGRDERVAWYVGWVENDTARYAFALNLDADRPEAAAARAPLVRALLARAGAAPARGCGA